MWVSKGPKYQKCLASELWRLAGQTSSIALLRTVICAQGEIVQSGRLGSSSSLACRADQADCVSRTCCSRSLMRLSSRLGWAADDTELTLEHSARYSYGLLFVILAGIVLAPVLNDSTPCRFWGTSRSQLEELEESRQKNGVENGIREVE